MCTCLVLVVVQEFDEANPVLLAAKVLRSLRLRLHCAGHTHGCKDMARTHTHTHHIEDIMHACTTGSGPLASWAGAEATKHMRHDVPHSP